MSGGHWNYSNDYLCNEIFDWCSACYDMKSADVIKNEAVARKLNPLEDKELSELVYDVFCVLHSYDWYRSGDTGEDIYRNDVAEFKKKWLMQPATERIKNEVDKALDEAKADLYQSFGIA